MPHDDREEQRTKEGALICNSPNQRHHRSFALTRPWLCTALRYAAGPKMRRWYGAPERGERLPRDGGEPEPEQEEESEPSVLVTNAESNIGEQVRHDGPANAFTYVMCRG